MPTGQQNDGGEQGRSNARSETDAAKYDAACLAAFMDGEPAFDELVCRGIHDGAAGAERDADEEKDPDGVMHSGRDEAGKNGEESPERDEASDDTAGAESSDGDAARNLEGGVADKKSAEDPAEVGVVDTEFFGDFGAGDGDVGSVKEGNGAEDEEPCHENVTDGQSTA